MSDIEEGEIVDEVNEAQVVDPAWPSSASWPHRREVLNGGGDELEGRRLSGRFAGPRIEEQQSKRVRRTSPAPLQSHCDSPQPPQRSRGSPMCHWPSPPRNWAVPRSHPPREPYAPRRGAGRGGAGRRAPAEAECRGQEQDAARLQELIRQIEELTACVRVPDALKSMDVVCGNLLSSLQRLKSLSRIYAQSQLNAKTNLVQSGSRIFVGLKSLKVLSRTAIGRTLLQKSAAARDVFAMSLQDQHILFTPFQRGELMRWMKGSQVLRSLAGWQEPGPLADGDAAQPPVCSNSAAKLTLSGKQTSDQPAVDAPLRNAEKAAGPDVAIRFDGHLLGGDPAMPHQGDVQSAPPPAQHSWLPPPVSPAPAFLAGAGALDMVPSFLREPAPWTPPRPATPPSTADPPGPLPSARPQRQPTAAAATLPEAASAPVMAIGGGDVSLPSPKIMNAIVPSFLGGAWLVPEDGPPPGLAETPRAQPASKLGRTATVGEALLALEPNGTMECEGVGAKGFVSGGCAGGMPLPLLDTHAACAASEDVQALLRERRLCAVLDLDHTLVNSARTGEVEPADTAKLEELAAQEAADKASPAGRTLFRVARTGMWTKLRPGVRELLAALAPKFQLWIHTNGTRSYAHAVAELLDADGSLFGERIIAAGTAGPASEVPEAVNLSKRLMQGLEGREAVAVILDDSPGVWAQHAHNLLEVERYVYFPSSRDQLRRRAPALLDTNRDECADSGMMAVMRDVLLRLHTAVFAALETRRATLPDGSLSTHWDVRHVLQQMRAQVLAGVTILFSGVIQLQCADPTAERVWQLAERFGAFCTTELGSHVTHVVATRQGTEKVAWAQRNGLFVVSRQWLECSCALWKRAREADFLPPLPVVEGQ